MILTTELLLRFRQGQMEVQNPAQAFILRGSVSDVLVDDANVLRVAFEWLAKGVGYPPQPTSWVADTIQRLSWSENLRIFRAADIGEGRIHLSSAISGDTVVFFPPGYFGNISYANVAGLGAPVLSEQ